MATENCWRARRIQTELSKLGIRVSLATISRYLPKKGRDPTQHQRWMSFLRDHRDVIAGMDFFVVPTVRFRLLYVWFAIDHGPTRLRHFNITTNPSAQPVIQQLRETFSEELTHRYLIYYNDARVPGREGVLALALSGTCPFERCRASTDRFFVHARLFCC